MAEPTPAAFRRVPAQGLIPSVRLIAAVSKLRCRPPRPLVRARAILKDPDDGLSPLAKSYRAAAPWLDAVWQLTGSAMMGTAMGYGVDRYFGVEPWGLVVGAVVGSGVGFYAFIRSTTRLSDAQAKKRKQQP